MPYLGMGGIDQELPEPPSWYVNQSIKKTNYYYWLCCTGEVCLENISGGTLPQQIVPIELGFLQVDEINDSNTQLRLDISIKGISVHVAESASFPIQTEVLDYYNSWELPLYLVDM